MKRALLCTGLMLLLGGCKRSAEPPFFPLDADRSWTYTQHTDNPAIGPLPPLTLRVAGRTQLEGAPAIIRRSSLGSEYWLRADEEGVQRVAHRTLLDTRPVPEASPYWVLRAPYVVGTWWENRTRPFVLTRVLPFHERLFHREGLSFSLQYEIAGVAETVQVPAGQFEDCVRVEASGRVQVIADPRVAVSEVDVNQTEWYCRGVGLTKLIRSEPLVTDQIVGGTLTLELSDYRP